MICDAEKEYAIGLMEYVNRKKTFPFEAVACTSKESLLRRAKKEPIDILLVAESMMEESIGNIPAVLTVVLGEGIGQSSCLGYQQVSKYQACDALVREVMEIYSASEDAVEAFSVLPNRKKEVIGVYSPCGDGRNTAFALALGQILAEQKRVLFASLSPFSGLEQLYRLPSGRDLSDLLYFREQGNSRLAGKLSGMTCETIGMDMIPPAVSPEDLFTVPPASWVMLFAEIMEKCPYEALVLDLGIPALPLLDACSRIWLLSGEDEISVLRTEQFLETLRQSRYREAERRIVTVRTREWKQLRTKGFYESPAESGYGQWVRKIAVRTGV